MSHSGGLELDHAEALFASPLFSFRVPDADALNHHLLDEIRVLRQQDAGIERSNVGGWHSSVDIFDRTERAWVALCAHLVAAVFDATRRVAPSFDPQRFRLDCEGWVNVLPRGACHAPHTHPTFAWSGVYYVAVDHPANGDSGALELFDPRPPIGYAPVQGAGCFQDTRRVHPRAGQLLLFPAYLRHWVYPTDGAQERVAVVFNARWASAPRSHTRSV